MSDFSTADMTLTSKEFRKEVCLKCHSINSVQIHPPTVDINTCEKCGNEMSEMIAVPNRYQRMAEAITKQAILDNLQKFRDSDIKVDESHFYK